MATFPLKYLHSAMQGAPTLSGTAGSLISVLDACLINGFNVLAPVSITVAAGEATVDYGTVHGYAAHDIIKVAGATPAELNGEQRITWVNSTTVKFATTAADGTATGTLETRTAPVGGWEKTYTGTNKGVYRQTDITGTRLYLRVDDTPTTYANITMFESMTDVDTGTAPTTRIWTKSNQANTTTRAWRLIGDGLMFYLATYWHSGYLNQAGINTFGDINTYKSGDAFHCLLGGNSVVDTSYPGYKNYFSLQTGLDNYCLLARSYSQIGANVTAGRLGLRNQDYTGYGGFVLPNPTDNGLLLHTPLIVIEPTTNAARGTLPGLIQPLQNVPLTDGFVVENIPQMPGKRVLLVGVGIANGNAECRSAFDITGPWR
ncbi:MAG: hypothetical protein JXK51_06665 [Halothiobacillaceae bacterium]|nr:hypothetical protein [Halothiobacillaceae bacterium]